MNRFMHCPPAEDPGLHGGQEQDDPHVDSGVQGGGGGKA
jgi:hypothetical protein